MQVEAKGLVSKARVEHLGFTKNPDGASPQAPPQLSLMEFPACHVEACWNIWPSTMSGNLHGLFANSHMRWLCDDPCVLGVPCGSTFGLSRSRLLRLLC